MSASLSINKSKSIFLPEFCSKKFLPNHDSNNCLSLLPALSEGGKLRPTVTILSGILGTSTSRVSLANFSSFPSLNLRSSLIPLNLARKHPSGQLKVRLSLFLIP